MITRVFGLIFLVNKVNFLSVERTATHLDDVAVKLVLLRLILKWLKIKRDLVK